AGITAAAGGAGIGSNGLPAREDVVPMRDLAGEGAIAVAFEHPFVQCADVIRSCLWCVLFVTRAVRVVGELGPVIRSGRDPQGLVERRPGDISAIRPAGHAAVGIVAVRSRAGRRGSHGVWVVGMVGVFVARPATTAAADIEALDVAVGGVMVME